MLWSLGGLLLLLGIVGAVGSGIALAVWGYNRWVFAVGCVALAGVLCLIGHLMGAV